MEFASACQPLGVRPIVGAEVTVAPDGVRPLTDARIPRSTSRSWSSRPTGWRNLCLLLTEAHAHTRGANKRRE